MKSTTINKFCIFILTHGRPDKVHTFKTLRDCGYTGVIFLVVDNQDKTLDRYVENFGKESVLVFSKPAAARLTDSGDNSGKLNSVVFARNICHELAGVNGYKNFIQMDDDYLDFRYKFDRQFKFISKRILNLDIILAAMIKYYDKGKFLTFSMSQEGDFIGGENSGFYKKVVLHRKAMNVFICSTERP